MAAKAAAAAGRALSRGLSLRHCVALSARASASLPRISAGAASASASGQAVSRSPALAQLLKDDELRKLLMEIDDAAGCAANFIWMCS